MHTQEKPAFQERTLIALIGAVQFINILDFMMVMPLGPDFAIALGIPTSQLGIIGGSYTAAAAVSGILGAFVLDRFDRRQALTVSMVGLVLGTAAGALAVDLPTLLAGRVLAGLFGGPATSVSLSIIADVIPAERRGKAMGAVMGAFSAASVLGVPAGLELARLGGWRAPFVGVASLGFVVTLVGFLFLPPLRLHLQGARSPTTVRGLFALFIKPLPLIGYCAIGLAMMSAFSIIPNIAGHLQQNLHYPRQQLGVLYLIGGSVSFATMRFTGQLVDRLGSFAVHSVGLGGFSVVVWLGFGLAAPPFPVALVFALFMVSQTTRNVAMTTLMSRVPEPQERAGFLSLQSTVQHLASACGAVLSSKFLHDGPDQTILGVQNLALFSIALALCSGPLVLALERGVRRRAPHSTDAASHVLHG